MMDARSEILGNSKANDQPLPHEDTFSFTQHSWALCQQHTRDVLPSFDLFNSARKKPVTAKPLNKWSDRDIAYAKTYCTPLLTCSKSVTSKPRIILMRYFMRIHAKLCVPVVQRLKMDHFYQI